MNAKGLSKNVYVRYSVIFLCASILFFGFFGGVNSLLKLSYHLDETSGAIKDPSFESKNIVDFSSFSEEENTEFNKENENKAEKETNNSGDTENNSAPVPASAADQKALAAKKALIAEKEETKESSVSPSATAAVPTQSAPVQSSPAPVKYVWGSARQFTFRTEVKIKNEGTSASENVTVKLPMLENNSPYQTTKLLSTSHEIVSTSGRISTFVIPVIEPGGTEIIRADYKITVRPVAISSTNKTVETAREAYNKYAGSGNCHTLATGFVNSTQQAGIKARVVTGYTRPKRGHMTSGSLAGVRHSWAEFYVDGLGWVPVDLTFRYFADFPYASHIVETYASENIRITFRGGSLKVEWNNLIL